MSLCMSTARERPEERLVRRAFKLRARGENRRSMLVLREACHRQELDARLWTLYAAQCLRIAHCEEARAAFAHAIWLRERDRDYARARTTRIVLERLHAERAA